MDNIKKLTLFAALLILPGVTYAITLEEALINLHANLRPVFQAGFALAYVIGFWLVFSGIHKLRAFGQVRTMMPSHAEFTGPMVQFFIGILFIFLPTTIQISAGTFWGEPSLMEYKGGTGFEAAKGSLIYLIRFIGFIAFVRGLLILSKAGQKGLPPGTLGKGMVRLFGGLLALNVTGTMEIIKNTLLGG